MSVNLGALGEAFIEIRADLKALDKSIKDVDKKVTDGLSKTAKKSGDAFDKMAKRIKSTLSIAFAIGIAKSFISNVAEAQKTFAQLEATVKSTGGVAGFTASELAGMASGLQKVTTFGDEAIQSMQAILLTFTRLRGNEFKAAQEAILNVATLLGTDLKSAALQVGKALNDPIQGISALSRAGIQFSNAQKDLIRSFVIQNDIASAQRVILKELETQFGGSARAARDTLGGALQGLSNAFGDLFESTKTSTSSMVKAINGLTDVLNDPKTKEGIDSLIAGLGGVAEVAIKTASWLARVGQHVADFAKGGSTELERLLSKVRELKLEQARNADEPGFFNKAEQERLEREILAAQSELDRLTGRSGSSSRGRGRPRAAAVAPPVETAGGGLEEFIPTVQKIQDKVASVNQELEESTRTATQNAAADYIKLRTTLEFLFDEGMLGEGAAAIEEFNKRIGAALDDALPEFDLNEIRAKYKPVEQASKELGESIKSTLESNLHSALMSFESFGKTTSSILKAIFSELLRLAVIKPLVAGVTGFLGLAHGGHMEAGRAAIVGERGPELFVPSLSGTVVPNDRLKGGGGGGGGAMQFNQSINIPLAFPPQLEAYVRNVGGSAGRDAALTIMRAWSAGRV